MIRALIYLLLLAAFAVGFAWFADRPGELTINWPGYQIEITLFRFTVIVAIAVILLFFLVMFVGRLISSPRRVKRHMKQRRSERGYAALRRGIFAVGAGDAATAVRFAGDARRSLRNEPLTELLDAQSAQLSGDHRAAQRIFEAMSEKPETRLLGLRGLFMEASREGQMEAAEQYASRAMALNSNLPWPVNALFDIQCRAQNWQGALETLSVARNQRHIDKKVYDRRRAVLLTARAQDVEQKEPGRASDLALEAHRLAPDFIPAAVIAGRVLASQGNTGRAARVLARTWQYMPHPDLALSYAYARPGDSPRDRLARIKSLIVMTPDDHEARIALASAAVDAHDWQEARDALQPLLNKDASMRVCALMARIEGGEHRDAGRVREWLARALRAPRDAAWIADGMISNQWKPVSPVTGTLDAFEWGIPPDHSKAAEGDPLFEEISALSHELEAATKQIGDATVVDDDQDPRENTEPLTITVATKKETPTVAGAAPGAVPKPDVKTPPSGPAITANPEAETEAVSGKETSSANQAPPWPASEHPKDADPDSKSTSALVRGAAKARETNTQHAKPAGESAPDKPLPASLTPGHSQGSDLDSKSTSAIVRGAARAREDYADVTPPVSQTPPQSAPGYPHGQDPDRGSMSAIARGAARAREENVRAQSVPAAKATAASGRPSLPAPDPSQGPDPDTTSTSAIVRGAAKAREEAKQVDPAPEALPVTQSASGAAKSQTPDPADKTPPEIFMSGRPPDDPGPGSADFDEASTPYTRYRTPPKQQST